MAAEARAAGRRAPRASRRRSDPRAAFRGAAHPLRGGSRRPGPALAQPAAARSPDGRHPAGGGDPDRARGQVRRTQLIALLGAVLLSACIQRNPLDPSPPDGDDIGLVPATLFLEPGAAIAVPATSAPPPGGPWTARR